MASARSRIICVSSNVSANLPTGVSSAGCQSDPNTYTSVRNFDSRVVTPHFRPVVGMPLTTQSPLRNPQTFSLPTPKKRFLANAAASLKAYTMTYLLGFSGLGWMKATQCVGLSYTFEPMVNLPLPNFTGSSAAMRAANLLIPGPP